MEDAKSILSRWAGMVADRAPWDSNWQEVSDYALPRKGNLSRKETGPGTNTANRLYDTTAIQAVAVLASGHSSAITPAGTQWFAWEAPDDIKSDDADKWYNQCSEITRKILTSGNFHTMLNECFEDRAGFGLCCLAALPASDGFITFQAHPVGSFCIDEDAAGNVDTIFLRREYSIRQLVQLFGEDVIAANDKLAKSWEKFQEKGIDAAHFVIHAVFPRIHRDSSKTLEAVNMPIASVWVAEDGKTVLKRSGFEEMPYMVSRYLKRTGSKQAYGYAPFEQVKAAVLDCQKIKQILQVVGQKLAVPPVLVPDNLVGNVDTRPGGKTVFKSTNATLPQEWLTRAQPSGMLDELNDSRSAIREAYHTDLFRMFSEREKQMTAREVSELAAEKLMPFSPSFTRFTADFQVMMEAIFAILFRAGCFGNPFDGKIPQSVIRLMVDGSAEVPPPRVVYQSRIALAIRQTETAAADRLVERAANLAQLDPSVMDNIDTDVYLRMSGRNDGVADAVLRPEKDMAAMREARAEAQAQQAEIEQAKIAAEAAGKVGIKIPMEGLQA